MLPSASMAGRGLRALVLAMGVEMGAAVTQSKASPTPLPAVNRRDFVTALGAAGCMVSYEAAPLLHDGMEQAMGGPTCEGMEELARAASVFCNGPLLDAVQRAGVFADCKVFVDSPLKVEPEEVLRRFSLLPPDASKAELRTFVLENFDRPGTDLVPWAPVDYTDRPPALARLQNAELSEWAHSLNSFWAQLGRATSAEVAESPHRRTLLPLPHPFVVPGGRFVETYYWDSYWIIKGLLASNMRDTARGMVQNMLHQLRTYGFIPNGGRLYYLNRSQPPMLSEMVVAMMDDNFDLELLREALPLLRDEYAFWMDTGDEGHAVDVTLASGESATLNRYVTSNASPRPESYLEDLTTANHESVRGESERTKVWAEIAAAAESGWDFSSRWMEDGQSLHSVRTSQILPVDLNAIMYRFECNMERLHAMAGETSTAIGYASAARARQQAISELQWNERRRQWVDYHWPTESQLQSEASASNWLPLWAGAFDEHQGHDAVASLRNSGLLQKGGVATTLKATEHQWDWPNAWAPLQEMLIEGCENAGGEGHALAMHIARVWTASNLKAWRKTNYMFEKYSAVDKGVGGGGGEYTPQVGFGWSNGVALSLLARYGDRLASNKLLQG